MSKKKNWTDVNTAYHIDQRFIWNTDSSKTSAETGARIYEPRTASHIPMGQHTSIFQAEVYANE